MIVIDSRAADPKAKVLVNASGFINRPDCPVRLKMGTKLTVMIISEKNNWGPTSLEASMMICACVRWPLSCSRCLCAFSIMMTAESTITPMASAIPPKLMMFALMPKMFIRITADSTPAGSTKIATRELRKWSRNRVMIRATTVISSSSFCLSVATARSISAERSYSVWTSTPGGNPCRNWSSLFLVSSIT